MLCRVIRLPLFMGAAENVNTLSSLGFGLGFVIDIGISPARKNINI